MQSYDYNQDIITIKGTTLYEFQVIVHKFIEKNLILMNDGSALIDNMIEELYSLNHNTKEITSCTISYSPDESIYQFKSLLHYDRWVCISFDETLGHYTLTISKTCNGGGDDGNYEKPVVDINLLKGVKVIGFKDENDKNDDNTFYYDMF